MGRGSEMTIEMRTIKAGWGITVGQNFTRLETDTPFELDATAQHPRCYYGWIAGDPDHRLVFMRLLRIRVMVDKRCVE